MATMTVKMSREEPAVSYASRYSLPAEPKENDTKWRSNGVQAFLAKRGRQRTGGGNQAITSYGWECSNGRSAYLGGDRFDPALSRRALRSHLSRGPEPVNVVSAVPYYSSYPEETNFLCSALYKWAGDAYTFDKEGPYIELVTMPNNPDGQVRGPTVNRNDGKLIHDLAYYWPQYTPITAQADYDIMLFTFSKSMGHAGSRIGWAVVKDKDVAIKMTKYIELNSIGLYRENLSIVLLKFSAREVISRSRLFSLPKYMEEYCQFSGEDTEPHPAFAWLKCNNDIEDLEIFLRRYKIMGRGGSLFGSDPKHVRVSMLGDEETFNLFLERLSSIQDTITNSNGNGIKFDELERKQIR
ncbi:L-tryptophan--pyruvate aminotransferase 1 [Vitis vinifera]|uniref:L-tryptophan--pyruvate aminotransferase 1 n=1 Tax=Vitis vinifera TaxID=29760 RepID=A0A438J600_VITVI|nr:L-tryptophan--pyruvate aminotransferase 1 [Vitis vinifera]